MAGNLNWQTDTFLFLVDGRRRLKLYVPQPHFSFVSIPFPFCTSCLYDKSSAFTNGRSKVSVKQAVKYSMRSVSQKFQ